MRNSQGRGQSVVSNSLIVSAEKEEEKMSGNGTEKSDSLKDVKFGEVIRSYRRQSLRDKLQNQMGSRMEHEGTYTRIHEDSSRYTTQVVNFNLGDRTYNASN